MSWESAMRFSGVLMASALCLAPLATAADETSSLAVGYICSAEDHPVAAGSVRQLVMVKGVGTGGFAIATDKPEAQAWFDYGMQLAHAFYHSDAKLAFRKAQEIDPACAMCVWGEAWAAGPTINYGIDDKAAEAVAVLADKAAKLGAGESPKNRALIAALELRYATHDAAADVAFARAMDALSRRYPDDDEVAVMTSDAWLIPWAFYQDHQGVDRAVEVLEPVLKRHPDNTAAIHFYIHATEEAGRPALALPYAQRLGELAPSASHLVHMASHTFFAVGLYEDAAMANAHAIAVDGDYLRTVHDATPQGGVAYHSHDLRFGLASALASGDARLGLRLADHTWFAYPGAAADDAPGVVGQAYVVYGRYDPARALALPELGKTASMAVALRHYARGEAFAARGDIAGVRAEAALTVAPENAFKGMSDKDRSVGQAVVEIARLTLQGRAAMLEGHPDAAATAYRGAVRLQDTRLTGPRLKDPPKWWFPERRSLAAALLAAGRPAQAAEEAEKALKAWPLEPLTLQVLAKAERAQGKTDAASRDLARARRTWRGGDVPLPLT